MVTLFALFGGTASADTTADLIALDMQSHMRLLYLLLIGVLDVATIFH